jgi:hypothetical protein
MNAIAAVWTRIDKSSRPAMRLRSTTRHEDVCAGHAHRLSQTGDQAPLALRVHGKLTWNGPKLAFHLFALEGNTEPALAKRHTVRSDAVESDARAAARAPVPSVEPSRR